MKHYSVKDAYKAMYDEREEKDTTIQGAYQSIYEKETPEELEKEHD